MEMVQTRSRLKGPGLPEGTGEVRRSPPGRNMSRAGEPCAEKALRLPCARKLPLLGYFLRTRKKPRVLEEAVLMSARLGAKYRGID